MASDLLIEMFAYDVFHSFYLESGLISHKLDIFEIYGEDCLAVPEYKTVCNSSFYDAIKGRFAFYYHVYAQEIRESVQDFIKTCLDFDNYINRMCSRVEAFGSLTVFERLFGTCAFVWALNYFCRILHVPPVDWVKYSHICWSMHFDKYADEFYEQGGWIQLGRVAKDYISTNQFLEYFKYDVFLKSKYCVDNYANFKRVSQFNNHESPSMSWVKFSIEQLRSCKITDASLNSKNYSYFTISEMENVFQAIKRFSNPPTPKIIVSSSDCMVQTKFLNDNDLATNYTGYKNSVPTKTEIKETKMHFEPFKMENTLLSSDDLTSREAPRDKKKLPSELIDYLTNISIDKINDYGGRNSLKDIDPKPRIKPHNDHGIETDVSIEGNLFPLDADCPLQNVLQYTELKQCQNEILKTEEFSSPKDIRIDVRKNTSDFDNKCSYKGNRSSIKGIMQERTNESKNLSPSRDIERDIPKNVSSSKKRHSDERKRNTKGKRKEWSKAEESNEIKDLLRMILVLGS